MYVLQLPSPIEEKSIKLSYWKQKKKMKNEKSSIICCFPSKYVVQCNLYRRHSNQLGLAPSLHIFFFSIHSIKLIFSSKIYIVWIERRMQIALAVRVQRKSFFPFLFDSIMPPATWNLVTLVFLYMERNESSANTICKSVHYC